MNKTSPDIAKSIKEARLAAGISQALLAEKLEISKRTLIKYENGENEISARDLHKIAQLCNADFSSFFNPQVTGLSRVPISEISDIKAPRYNEYRIEATIPAGLADIQERTGWYESEILDYDPQSHFFLQIDEEYGYSMMPVIEPGDLVLVSLTARVKTGNIVVARWDETKGAVKIFNESPNKKNIALISYNQAVAPIFLERNQVQVYKVVLIKKMN